MWIAAPGLRLRPAFAAGATAVFVAALTAGALTSGGDDVGAGDVARRAVSSVPGLIADRPGEAALQALAAARLDPSSHAAELAMLGVAVDGSAIEQVVRTGAQRVTAAARTDRFLVTAGADGRLRVWRSSDGGLVGETRTARSLTRLVGSGSTTLLAASDRAGRVALLDLTEPRRPRLWPLAAALSPGEDVLALAFADDAVEVVAVGAGGEVGRVDTTTGRLVSRDSVLDLAGPVPWSGERPAPTFTAARFAPEAEAEEGLALATDSGAVVLADLGARHVRTVLAAGIAPGRVTSLDYRSYGTPELVVATEGGMLTRAEPGSELQVVRGPPVTGVAFDFEDGFWWGNGEGVRRGMAAYDYYASPAPAGPPVLQLEGDAGGLVAAGPVAIYPHGAVGLIGRADGLALPRTEAATPVARFDPHGDLLVAEGYDANHIEKLALLRPGRHLNPDGEVISNPARRHFRPAPDWWPDAEDDEALYVNDVDSDGELVVAGGQDPMGEAAVLVWDAETGRPLRHLVLGTGGVEIGGPSIVSQVVLLPDRNLLAAYSIVQELVAIWSTDTWELEATVPIGPVGDLSPSPDGATLVAASISDEEAEDEAEGTVYPVAGRGRLLFVDTEAGELTRELEMPASVHRVAWSPDGRRIAVLDGRGRLGLRSADGEAESRPPIRLDDVGVALAWRPDGDALAVALRGGGVVIVDPGSGAVSPSIPFEDYTWSPSLSWSPDGALLATAMTDPDDEGEIPGPGRAAIWGLGAARLEQRMCRLAGGPASVRQWRRLADPNLPYRPLCRSAAERGAGEAELEDAALLGPLALAFERDDRIFAVDAAGRSARIGRLEPFTYPAPTFAWSPDALAWISPGQVHLLREGASRAESWPCACTGLAWDGDALLSLTRSGRELVRFRAGRRRPRVTRLSHSPGFAPSLLGILGRTAVLVAFGEEPTRATPGELFLVDPRGRVRRFPGRLEGAAYGQVVSSAAAADTVAFVDGVSAGICASTSRVGVLRRQQSGSVGVAFPPMPHGEEPQFVRSVQVAADGSVTAAIAPVGCDGYRSPEIAPAPRRYELRAGRWRSTGERGWDVQVAAGTLAFLRGEQGSSEADALVLATPGEDDPIPVSSDVDAIAGRP